MQRLLRDLRLKQASILGLIELVGGEVGGVNIGSQAWLERCPDPTQFVKLDSSKERVRFQLVRSATSKSVLRVANQTKLLVLKPTLPGTMSLTFGSNFQLAGPGEYHQGNIKIASSSQSFGMYHVGPQHRMEATLLSTQT